MAPSPPIYIYMDFINMHTLCLLLLFQPSHTLGICAKTKVMAVQGTSSHIGNIIPAQHTAEAHGKVSTTNVKPGIGRLKVWT